MDIHDVYAILRSLWVVWFLLLFLGIVGWAMWPANRRRFDDLGRIPLRDDR